MVVTLRVRLGIRRLKGMLELETEAYMVVYFFHYSCSYTVI